MRRFLVTVLATTTMLSCSSEEQPDVQVAVAEYVTIGSIERLDPALDTIVPPGAVLEILAEGHEWTEGPVWVPAMGPGTLYGALKRMLDAGLVEECGERPDPGINEERRIYYRITADGRRVAELEAERMDALVRSARAKSLLGNPIPKVS